VRLSGLGYTDPFLGSTGNIYFKYRFYLTYNPVDQTEATTKQYVDTSIQNSLANYLPLTGGALLVGYIYHKTQLITYKLQLSSMLITYL